MSGTTSPRRSRRMRAPLAAASIVTVALTLTVVSALKTFDLVYVTTRGGPGNATSVPAYEAYSRAFVSGQVGSAASVAVVLTIVILLVTVLISRLQPKEAE